MASRKNPGDDTATRAAIQETAIAVLNRWGQDIEVIRKVQALVHSRGDTLSDKAILEELRALASSGLPLAEGFADSTTPKMRTARRPRK